MTGLRRFFLLASLAVTLRAQAQWPATLEADVQSQSWEAAARVGEAIMEEIDAGRLFARASEAAQEAKVRNLFASALEHLGRVEEARFERCVAAELPQCAPKVAERKKRRMETARMELLASEFRQPAPPFRLKDHDGNEFALADLLGRPLVIAFTASWCPPCVHELAELDRYLNPRAARIAISLDDESSVHAFPILLANHAVTHDYLPIESLESPQVPQLYVLDGSGNIRFHLTGFEDDGWFTHRLDWMIEALVQERTR